MKTILVIQSVYYFITGLWPVFHMQSFEKVTGPKTDHWLVKTVGGLIACIALSVYCGAQMSHNNFPTIILALTSAAVLMIVDVVYSFKKVISRIYLLDAVLELILITALLFHI